MVEAGLGIQISPFCSQECEGSPVTCDQSAQDLASFLYYKNIGGSISPADAMPWTRLTCYWEPACSSDLDKEGTWGWADFISNSGSELSQ